MSEISVPFRNQNQTPGRTPSNQSSCLECNIDFVIVGVSILSLMIHHLQYLLLECKTQMQGKLDNKGVVWFGNGRCNLVCAGAVCAGNRMCWELHVMLNVLGMCCHVPSCAVVGACIVRT